MKTSFFLLFQNVSIFYDAVATLYDEVFLSSLLDGCYHCLVFMDPVNGYSKSELLVKEQVILKSKIRFGYACL